MAQPLGRAPKVATGTEPLLTTLGHWRADATSIGEVEAALAHIRCRAHWPALRSAALTLVVLSATEAEATNARRIVDGMGARRPAHTLVVVARPADRPGLEAEVRVEAALGAETTRCFQEICLRLSGTVMDHLDSVVRPLRLAGLPLVAWLSDRLPDPDEPLLRHADRVIVDSRLAASLSDPLGALVGVTRQLPVTDLSWVRLEPLRALLAGLFQGAVYQPFLRGVRHIRVAGEAGPRRLLAGWLASRLEFPAGMVDVTPGDRLSTEVLAEHDGRQGRFAVEPFQDAHEVRAVVEVSDGPRHVRRAPLRRLSDGRLLGRALTCFGADPVYDQALVAAAALPG